MRLLTICLALLLPASVSAQDAPRLTVEGRGEVAAVPDMAMIAIAVTREAEAAEEAMAALSEAADAVLARVTDEGVAAEDVQTGQLSLQPRWDHSEDRQPPRIAGYVARTTLELRVRDLDALGALLDAAVSDGANGLEGLRFALSDPGSVEDAARRAAFADAMAKAELYAGSAGLTVGGIVSLTEGGAARPPGPVFAMAMEEAARAVPIAPGEVTQAIVVTLTVELAPAR